MNHFQTMPITIENYGTVVSMIADSVFSKHTPYTVYINTTQTNTCELEEIPQDVMEGLMLSPQHTRMTALLRKQFGYATA